MSAYQEAERLLASLTPAEKARLLQAVARELDYSDPGVERASDMCGGEACIVRTRIPA